MVFLSYLIALSLICFCLGLLLLIFSKSKLQMNMSFIFLFLSGIFLISSSILSADTVLFFLLGLVTITIILAFHFRDQLLSNIHVEATRREEIE